MTNPISLEIRGRIYLAGLIIGGLAVVAGPIMAALEVPSPWVSVVTSLIGAVTGLCALLAHDNLSEPNDYVPKHGVVSESLPMNPPSATDPHIPYLDN